MAVMAQWMGKTWQVSSKQILALEDLSTSRKLKKENNSDTEGQPATNARGFELQTLSFSFKAGYAAGVDVRREYESWEDLVGESGPFLIGGRRFGPAKYQLLDVSLDDVVFGNDGRMIEGRISANFQEDAQEPTSLKEKTVNKNAPPAAGIASSSAIAGTANPTVTAASTGTASTGGGISAGTRSAAGIGASAASTGTASTGGGISAGTRSAAGIGASAADKAAKKTAAL